jgi:hypothetical protein
MNSNLNNHIKNNTKKLLLILLVMIIIIICLKYNIIIFYTYLIGAPRYKFVTKWQIPYDMNVDQFAIDTKGYIYLAYNIFIDKDNNDACIKKFDSNGHFIKKWDMLKNGLNQFCPVISGISSDSKDNIYVLDNNNYTIQKFTSDGDFICFLCKKREIFPKKAFVEKIAIDTEGNIFITSPYSLIYKLDSNDNLKTKWKVQRDISDIKLDSQGNVYVASSRDYWPGVDESDDLDDVENFGIGVDCVDIDLQKTANENNITYDSCVNKFDSSGKILSRIYNVKKKTKSRISHIMLDSHNRLFVTECHKHRIIIYDNKGNIIGKFHPEGFKKEQFKDWDWINIAIDREDNIYLLEYRSNFIYKFSPKH